MTNEEIIEKITTFSKTTRNLADQYEYAVAMVDKLNDLKKGLESERGINIGFSFANMAPYTTLHSALDGKHQVLCVDIIDLAIERMREVAQKSMYELRKIVEKGGMKP